MAAADAAPTNRDVVSDQFAATAGEDRRAIGEACTLLLALPRGRTSELAAVRGDAGCDGNFYAESNSGGNGNGTVAQISPSGSVNVILNFNGTDGSNEIGGMTLGTDCNLYGNTWSGGTSGQGITFKITPACVETPLHNFTNTGDGNNPANALILGNDGNFYGTSNGTETIYRVSPSGTFKTLHSFGITFGGGQLKAGAATGTFMAA